MHLDMQQKPLFVPFQTPAGSLALAVQKKYFVRSIVASMTAFLIAVTLVSYMTNRYEEKLHEIKASTAACQAVNPPGKQSTTN